MRGPEIFEMFCFEFFPPPKPNICILLPEIQVSVQVGWAGVFCAKLSSVLTKRIHQSVGKTVELEKKKDEI